MVFQMRLAAGLLALGLSLMVFFAAREWFGEKAALIAMGLVVFDPNLLAHSALVTTDIGITLFFLASIYRFYRYVKQPTLARLGMAGVAAGLLLATKHSGILLAPMLVLLIVWEIGFAPKGERRRVALRLCGAFAGNCGDRGGGAVGVLWLPVRGATRGTEVSDGGAVCGATEPLRPGGGELDRADAPAAGVVFDRVDRREADGGVLSDVCAGTATGARGVVVLPSRDRDQDDAWIAGAGGAGPCCRWRSAGCGRGARWRSS